MNDNESEYLEVLGNVLYNGINSKNRTDTATRKLFGLSITSNLFSSGFNALESKFVSLPTLMHELHWFLDGETNADLLAAHKVKIWDKWKDDTGRLGPVYGKQWRAREEIIRLDKRDLEYQNKYSYLINGDDRGTYEHEETSTSSYFRRDFDQIGYAIQRLKTKPDDRRIIIDTWNSTVLPIDDLDPTEQAALGRQALAPCHAFFQFGSVEVAPILVCDRGMHNVTFNEDGTVLLDGFETSVSQEDIYTSNGFYEALDEVGHNTCKETRMLSLGLYQRKQHCALAS